jgi:hypothetical protein
LRTLRSVPLLQQAVGLATLDRRLSANAVRGGAAALHLIQDQ